LVLLQKSGANLWIPEYQKDGSLQTQTRLCGIGWEIDPRKDLHAPLDQGFGQTIDRLAGRAKGFGNE